MTGTEMGELRDKIVSLHDTNGIRIKGCLPLADELARAGYRKESVVVDEVFALVRQSIQPSCAVEEILDRVREEYLAGGTP